MESLKLKKPFNKHIVSTLALIIFISVCFVLASVQVTRIATESCFATLDDAANQVADEIAENVKNDREQLSVIADLMAQHEDLEGETATPRFLLQMEKPEISS